MIFCVLCFITQNKNVKRYLQSKLPRNVKSVNNIAANLERTHCQSQYVPQQAMDLEWSSSIRAPYITSDACIRLFVSLKEIWVTHIVGDSKVSLQYFY